MKVSDVIFLPLLVLLGSSDVWNFLPESYTWTLNASEGWWPKKNKFYVMHYLKHNLDFVQLKNKAQNNFLRCIIPKLIYITSRYNGLYLISDCFNGGKSWLKQNVFPPWVKLTELYNSVLELYNVENYLLRLPKRYIIQLHNFLMANYNHSKYKKKSCSRSGTEW